MFFNYNVLLTVGWSSLGNGVGKCTGLHWTAGWLADWCGMAVGSYREKLCVLFRFYEADKVDRLGSVNNSSWFLFFWFYVSQVMEWFDYKVFYRSTFAILFRSSFEAGTFYFWWTFYNYLLRLYRAIHKHSPFQWCRRKYIVLVFQFDKFFRGCHFTVGNSTISCHSSLTVTDTDDFFLRIF